MIIAQSPRIPEYLRAFFSLMVQMWWHRFVDYEVTVSYTTNRGGCFFHTELLVEVDAITGADEVTTSSYPITGGGKFVPKVFPFTPRDFLWIVSVSKGGSVTHTHPKQQHGSPEIFSPLEEEIFTELGTTIIFRWTLLNFRGRVFTVRLWVVKIMKFEISTLVN